MSMTIRGIKNAVQTLLAAETTVFETVLPHEPTQEVNFQGYPSVSHYYKDTQSDVATVTQNRRTIQYTVEIFLLMNPNNPIADEYDQAYKVIDDTVQLFDQSNDLNNACDWLRPTIGSLESVKLPEGQGFVATIQLFCVSDIVFAVS